MFEPRHHCTIALFSVLVSTACWGTPPASPAAVGDSGDDTSREGGADAGNDDGPPGPACTDGQRNGDETDVDCGGECERCEVGAACVAGEDCLSTICINGSCAATTCQDGIQAGDETDVDCGGSCPPCDVDAVCSVDDDCVSAVCAGGVCAAPTCSDGVANGAETGADCGGPDCGEACPVGEGCAATEDCIELNCDEGVCTYPRSCAHWLDLGIGSEDGRYMIDPDGAAGPAMPLEVTCDMMTDGEVGYTMVRVEDANLGADPADYRAACEELGLEIIVPRTRAHALSILAFNNGQPPNVVNVYPDEPGASGLDDWTGRCQGTECTYYLADRIDATCGGTFQPDGDPNDADQLLINSGPPAELCPIGDFEDRAEMQETGWVICSTNDRLDPPVLASCLEIRDANRMRNTDLGELSDRFARHGINGIYTINPAGSSEPVDVFCDFDTDGGGYTYLKIDTEDSSLVEAEMECEQFGMQLFIPRTRAHRLAAFDVGDSDRLGPSGRADYLEILGIYADNDAANCSFEPFRSSNPFCPFSASDDGPYYVHHSWNFGEPDGSVPGRDEYEYGWDSGGFLIEIDDRGPGDADSERWMCDVGDKLGPE